MVFKGKGIVYLILLLSVSFGISCRKKVTPTDYTVLSIDKKNYTYNTDFYHMSIEYPQEIWDFEHEMQQYVENVVAFYKRDWSPGGMHYEKEMSFRNVNEEKEYPKFELYIRYQSFNSTAQNTHSYLFSSYVTTGGANGTTHVAAFNFNQGGHMEYQEVFAMNSDQEISLSRLLAEQVKDSAGVFDYETVKEGLGLKFISATDASLDSLSMKKRDFNFRSNFNAFVITDTGIHFHFDKYTLASGASGTTSIFLNWEQLKPYLGTKYSFNVQSPVNQQ